jgi:predicted porin
LLQKKLIALAIAGLSGAAFAQSNVTIYGVMDATYDNVSATGASSNTNSIGGYVPNAPGYTGNLASRGRTTFNSSYIGFKGVEPLGNGLAVAFQIETGIGENPGTSFGGPSTGNSGTGVYGWANRDTYVGLAGPFGTLAAGNLTGPTRGLGAAMDVNSGATGIGNNGALLGKLGGGSGAGLFDQRIANAIAYISPAFLGGFTGVIGYLPNENRGLDTNLSTTAPTANTSGWTLGLTFANGPFYVAGSWTKVKDANANDHGSGLGYNQPFFTSYVGLGALPIDDATDARLAFKWDFGMGTIGVMWDQTKASINHTLAGGGDVKQTVWYIPLTVKLGNGTLIAQYGHANNMSIDGTLGTFVSGATAGVGGTDFSARHYEIGYEYAMSKRTTLKALYSKIDNKKDATYDFLYGVAAPNTTAFGGGAANSVAPGADPQGISLGIRHSF